MTAKPELVTAARQLLDQMGISLAELQRAAGGTRPVASTFTEYVPVVAAAVSPGSRRMYGTYWKIVLENWGDRRLDEPTPTQIETLMRQHQANALRRRNYRRGRSAAEHLISVGRSRAFPGPA
jgi:integrase/recombinase XerC